MFRLFFLQSTINIRVTYIIGSRTVSLSRSSMTTKKNRQINLRTKLHIT